MVDSISRRTLGLGLGAVAAAPAGVAVQAQAGVFTPEMFGARGDGVSDDYPAWRRLAEQVSRAGGGRVICAPRRRYLLNRYRITEGRRRNTVDNIVFRDCRGLSIDLNGSVVAVRGGFHRTKPAEGSHAVENTVIPFMFLGGSDITLRNGELYGAVDQITKDDVLEGQCMGVAAYAADRLVLEDLDIHHFAADGVYLATDQFTSNRSPCRSVTLRRVTSRNNARQGLSNTGTTGLVCIDCRFNETGRTGRYGHHAPGAGADIEPNGPMTSPADGEFVRCEFRDNIGSPLISAMPGLVSRVVLRECRGSSPHRAVLQLVASDNLVLGGEWRNISIGPAYGAPMHQDRIRVSVEGGVWRYDNVDAIAVIDVNPNNPEVLIRSATFRLEAGAPYRDTYVFLCQSPNHVFESNRVFISGRAHPGGGVDTLASFAGARLVRNNQWTTDAPAGAAFQVNYRGAKAVGGERLLSGMTDGDTLKLVPQAGLR
jgi:hypothetical protein